MENDDSSRRQEPAVGGPPVTVLAVQESAFWIAAAAVFILYGTVRTVTGRWKFREHLARIEEEGILRAREWVFTRIRFPLIHRITFTRVMLSRRRFVVFHGLTRRLLLQAPLGPKGVPGKEEGRFETEGKEGKKRLVFRTPRRGGGRIRFHLPDAEGWLADIRENE